MAGHGEVVLNSETRNGDMVIVAYEAAHKIGALAHALFLGDYAVKHNGINRLREASVAIDEMIADMALLGADRDAIEVSLVLGDNHHSDKVNPEFEKSLHETLDLLRERHVKFRDNITGDNGMAKVSLDVESGTISCI